MSGTAFVIATGEATRCEVIAVFLNRTDAVAKCEELNRDGDRVFSVREFLVGKTAESITNYTDKQMSFVQYTTMDEFQEAVDDVRSRSSENFQFVTDIHEFFVNLRSILANRETVALAELKDLRETVKSYRGVSKAIKNDAKLLKIDVIEYFDDIKTALIDRYNQNVSRAIFLRDRRIAAGTGDENSAVAEVLKDVTFVNAVMDFQQELAIIDFRERAALIANAAMNENNARIGVIATSQEVQGSMQSIMEAYEEQRENVLDLLAELKSNYPDYSFK